MGQVLFCRSNTLRFCASACFALLSIECKPGPCTCTCIVKTPQLPPDAYAAPNTSVGAHDAGGINSLVETADSGQTNSTRKVVWNGDSEGSNAKGWADCDKKPLCKSSLAPQASTGVKRSVGLKLHGEGDGWIGGGWNFYGWWPADAGLDITAYKSFKLAIRIESPHALILTPSLTFSART